RQLAEPTFSNARPDQPQPEFLMSERTQWALLALAIGIGFYLHIGSMPLFDLDEGAFTQSTREMFLRDDFISPYLNGEPRFDKPILIYWLQAASVGLFGFNEFALRLPSALAATGWVLLVWAFVARVRGREAAFWSAFILATSLQVTVVGKAAIADATLILFMTAALFATYLHYLEDRRRWVLLAFVAMGLGFLTKGPVAVVIPAVVSFLFYAWQGAWRRWFRAVFDPVGIGLFLLIALPWYVLQYLREGQAFIDGFFFRHNLQRFSEPIHGHSGGLWFYPVTTLLAVLPFTALVFLALSRLRQDIRAEADPLARFLWIWFGFVLVFFSFSGTKLPHYLNYGLTGLVILMALALPQARQRFWYLLPPLLVFALLLALPRLVAVFRDEINPPYVRELLADHLAWFGPGWYLFLAVVIALCVAGLFLRGLSVPRLLLPVGLAFSLVVNGQLLPIVGGLQQGPIRDAGKVAADLEGDFVMYGLNTPSFSVYSGHLVDRRQPEPGEYALTRRDLLDDFAHEPPLFERAGIVLVRAGKDD
ncbi:MAG: ArnT family glycosyltransferase, partial [Halothiobacillaceae bacterium]